MGSLDSNSRIGFIGAGVVGTSLAVALSRGGRRVVAASSRTFASARKLVELVPGCTAYPTASEVANSSDVVFISTSDDAISKVASSISWRQGQGVVHCAGAASLDVLEHPVSQGAVSGSFHPLQSFSSVENGVESIPGTTFGIEGSDEMRAYLQDTALAIGGNPIFVKSDDKALYHLSGVMVGGLLATLAGVASQLWERFGIPRAEGLEALVPMMRQGVVNLETSGIPDALVGPYARGDIGTVRKHLEALRSRAPEVLPLYCELALAGIPLALEKGTLGRDRADEIRELVDKYRGEASALRTEPDPSSPDSSRSLS